MECPAAPGLAMQHRTRPTCTHITALSRHGYISLWFLCARAAAATESQSGRVRVGPGANRWRLAAQHTDVLRPCLGLTPSPIGARTHTARRNRISPGITTFRFVAARARARPESARLIHDAYLPCL